MKKKIQTKELDFSNSSLYLDKLKEFEIEPNFFCSLEYFQKSGCQESHNNLILGVWDAEGNALLPMIDLNHKSLHGYIPDNGIWADLPGYQPLYYNQATGQSRFMDYQYIYDPKQFLDMQGGQWAVFRKNSRKFPRRYGEDRLQFATDMDPFRVEVFSTDVIKNFDVDTIYDPAVMIRYLFFGMNRLFILDNCSLRILAVSIWDENYKYINYRFCLCQDEPFLSEYARLKFYEYMAQNTNNCNPKGKLINDGGVLDKPSLKAFKDKMNPLKIDKIHSWF